MPYPKCKIYSDGGHYIAIPHTTRPYRPRKKPKEEVIAVTEEVAEETQQPAAEQSAPSTEDAPMPLEETVSDTVDCTEIADTLPEMPTTNRLMTKKQLFEELYARYQSLPRYKRKAAILKRMRPYFSDAAAISRTSAAFEARGFSQSTCLPLLMQSMACEAWSELGVAI